MPATCWSCYGFESGNDYDNSHSTINKKFMDFDGGLPDHYFE